MRTIPLLFAASIALLLLPLPLAGASESFGCHEWTVFVGDRETGAGVSSDTATYAGAEGFYVFNDGAPVLNDWVFSIWIYQESNGVPGAQRGDEVCDETNGGEFEPDFGCIC